MSCDLGDDKNDSWVGYNDASDHVNTHDFECNVWSRCTLHYGPHHEHEQLNGPQSVPTPFVLIPTPGIANITCNR